MPKAGRHFSLTTESLNVPGELRCPQDLDGHEPVEAHLACAINHSHAAARDFLQQFVIAERTKNAGSQARLDPFAQRFAQRVDRTQSNETTWAIVFEPIGLWCAAVRTYLGAVDDGITHRLY